MAAAIASAHPGAARAVLFYGSCLRERQLDGLMLDFYLIVSDYRAAYAHRWLAAANRLIPPNVFPFEHDGLAAKYAVLSEADFARECRPAAASVSVWARFAQPSRLVWAADAAAREAAVVTVAEAPVTLFEMTLPILEQEESPTDRIWEVGFGLTYGAELRAERTDKGRSLIAADEARYRRFTLPVLGEIARRKGVGAGGEVPLVASPDAMRRRWRRLRRNGKAVTILRLLKASLTFADGIDYLAWKINRHAGTRIEVKPWQRRWPLVAGLILLPRLLRRGAIR
jgi:hypothetical protein